MDGILLAAREVVGPLGGELMVLHHLDGALDTAPVDRALRAPLPLGLVPRTAFGRGVAPLVAAIRRRAALREVGRFGEDAFTGLFVQPEVS